MGRGRKRKATEDPPRTGVYLIQCSRKSELIEQDDDQYAECWTNEDADSIRQDLEGCATAGDSTWIYDSKSSGSLETSSDQIVTFVSKEAANSTAAALWKELLEHHPFDQVYKPEAGGEESSEGEDESDQEGKGQRSGAAATHKTKPSGRVRFERTQQYTIDPLDQGTLKNIVKSTLVVQVIQSRAGG